MYIYMLILGSLFYLSMGLFVYQGCCFLYENKNPGKSASRIKIDPQKRKALLRNAAITLVIMIFIIFYPDFFNSRAEKKIYWLVLSILSFFYIPIVFCIVVKDFRELYKNINLSIRYLLEEVAQILPNIINITALICMLCYLYKGIL